MSVELLSPAGNFEKLVSAVRFGCDAVYLSGGDFSLRAKSSNFKDDELKKALKYLHENGKKGYVTVNIYARNDDFKNLSSYLEYLDSISTDGLIISDLGVFKLVREMGIKTPVHISTQANTTNYMTVKFFEDLGVKRVILARELSEKEVEFIVKNTSVDIEIFVHGAMCISHSGRCVLSNYMTGRDANRGECTHPCRWNYYLVEETRPGEYLKIEQDARGSYIYNSKDLCLIDYLKNIIDMGVKSLKIEGRMKSSMYASVVTGVYRKAIDDILKYGEIKEVNRFHRLLNSVSNRNFTTGFLGGNLNDSSMNYETSSYVRLTDYLGLVEDVRGEEIIFFAKGKFSNGEKITILNTDMVETEINSVLGDIDGRVVDFTKPNSRYVLRCLSNHKINPGAVLRRYL